MWEAGKTLPGDLTGPSLALHTPRPGTTRRVPVLRAAARAAVRAAGMATAGARPLPDFLIIGAKRSGTTSLHNWLLAHPDVLPLFPSARRLPLRADIKGVHFFDAAPERSVRWYRSHFPTAVGRAVASRRSGGARVLAGEATPYSLHPPRAAARAAAVVPDARLIVLLRDPVERAWSHWKEQRRRGFEPLDTFEAAIDAEPGRLAGED